MAVVYNNTVKEDRLDVVIAAIDAGSAAGYIEIGTAAMAATLVTIDLDDPCATASAGTLTLAGTPLTGTASGTGTAAAARIRDSDDNDIVTGLTVGTSGANINLATTSIVSGVDVEITSGTITHG